MTAWVCQRGRVVAATDRPGEVTVKHHKRRFSMRAEAGTFVVTCECCEDEYYIVPEGIPTPVASDVRPAVPKPRDTFGLPRTESVYSPEMPAFSV